MNGVYLSAFPKGQEAQAVDKMISFWRDAGEATLYQNWWGGVFTGLFWEGGLYDPSPLKSFIKDHVEGLDAHRDIKVGIVNVLSGDYLAFTKQNITESSNLIDALYASFMIAGIFPPAESFGS